MSLTFARRSARRRDRKGERGQAIVLLAATSLIVAATLLTTFSIGKAIHERVAVQQAADASAYSLAVEEARAFNYYAYSNRAIVSHYVAIMAIYGHMSYALAWKRYLEQAKSVWCDQITAELAVYLTACIAEDISCWGCMTSVCTCLGQDIDEVQNNPCQNLDNELQDVNNTLNNDYIKNLRSVADSEMGVIQSIANDQKVMDTAVAATVSVPSQFSDKIAKQFGPKFKAELGAGLSNLNGVTPVGGNKTAAGYCDAVAGFSPLCSAQGANVTRTQIFASNADRYQPPTEGISGDFTRDRGVDMTSAFQQRLFMLVMQNDLPYYVITVSGHGMSRMVKQSSAGVGDPSGDLHQTNETNESGYRVAAHDHGDVTGMDWAPGFQCGWYELPFAAGSAHVATYAYSTPPKNPRGTQSAYSAGSNETTGQPDLGGWVYPKDYKTCGILKPQVNFRIATANQKQLLYNQPRTFAVISETFDKSSWGPFGLKLDKAIQMFDPGTKSTLDNIVNNAAIRGRESIYGVASGLAYYHRPGLWKEPPNFYNPYWRAKLHPFNPTNPGTAGSGGDELSKVLLGTYTGGGVGPTDFVSQLPQTQ